MAASREALYAEFLQEAAHRLADAMTHDAASPEVLVQLHVLTARMRLASAAEVVETAEQLARLVIETYAAPNSSFGDLRDDILQGRSDPLAAFSEACRKELSMLRG